MYHEEEEQLLYFEDASSFTTHGAAARGVCSFAAERKGRRRRRRWRWRRKRRRRRWWGYGGGGGDGEDSLAVSGESIVKRRYMYEKSILQIVVHHVTSSIARASASSHLTEEVVPQILESFFSYM